MKMGITMLLTSAGRRVGLMQCFRRAAESLGVNLRIVAVDVDPDWSPACQFADRMERVPRCTEMGYIEVLRDLCMAERISLVVPTIDTELEILAAQRSVLERVGVRVLVPDTEIVQVIRNKLKTVEILARMDVPVPKTHVPTNDGKWEITIGGPWIAKPIDGSCSKGIQIVESTKDLIRIPVDGSYVVQELCKGEEYTVNAFYTNGSPKAVIPHLRRFVRAGEVCLAETVDNKAFLSAAEGIRRAFPGLNGVICFQAFMKGHEAPVVFEINGRFGGGYPLADRAGCSFASWLLEEALGNSPQFHGDYEVGIRMLRYDAEVFFP